MAKRDYVVARDFKQVKNVIDGLVRTRNPKTVLLVLDVDDTLLDTSSPTLVATDKDLPQIIKGICAMGVRIKILTARPATVKSCVELYNHLQRIKFPCVSNVSQQAILTGATVDKGTALLSRHAALRNVGTIVFVDDVMHNLRDMRKRISEHKTKKIELHNILFKKR